MKKNLNLKWTFETHVCKYYAFRSLGKVTQNLRAPNIRLCVSEYDFELCASKKLKKCG